MLTITFTTKLRQQESFHYVESVRIRSYSGPFFSGFRLSIASYSVQMRENTDLQNFEHGRNVRDTNLVQKSLESTTNIDPKII